MDNCRLETERSDTAKAGKTPSVQNKTGKSRVLLTYSCAMLFLGHDWTFIDRSMEYAS